MDTCRTVQWRFEDGLRATSERLSRLYLRAESDIPSMMLCIVPPGIGISQERKGTSNNAMGPPQKMMPFFERVFRRTRNLHPDVTRRVGGRVKL